MTALTNRVTASSGRTRFALHLGEMIVAMLAGMLVLGGAVEGALALTDGSLSGAPTALRTAVMAITMTVPMVWWMHYRGHPVRHNLEMAGSMVVPTAVVIAMYWLAAIPSGSVLAIQHLIMVPAMVGVMLWRHEHYSH
jgi:hypothetical protein